MTTNNCPAIALTEAAQRLIDAQRVLIFIHQNPDGDAAALRLRRCFAAWAKRRALSVRMTCRTACVF